MIGTAIVIALSSLRPAREVASAPPVAAPVDVAA
jgi:hypothetical protein